METASFLSFSMEGLGLYSEYLQSAMLHLQPTMHAVDDYASIHMWQVVLCVYILIANLPPEDNRCIKDKSSAPKVSVIRRFHCS